MTIFHILNPTQYLTTLLTTLLVIEAKVEVNSENWTLKESVIQFKYKYMNVWNMAASVLQVKEPVT